MTTTGRLSTCEICGGTIECTPTGWVHAGDLRSGHHPHFAQPDDSAVSGPDHDDVCDGADCDHADHEAERALDEDADAYVDRGRD